MNDRRADGSILAGIIAMPKHDQALRVRNVMNPCDDIAHPDHPLREVVIRMRKRGIAFLPVVDGDEIVGVIEAEAIIRKHPSTADMADIAVRNVLSTDFRYCLQDDDLDTARAVAARDGHKHLIVVDDRKQLVGTVAVAALRGRPAGPGEMLGGADPRRAAPGEERHLVTSGRSRKGSVYGLSSYSVKPTIKD